MLLDNEISVSKALKEFIQSCKKSPGRPKEKAWIDYIKQTLGNSDIGMTVMNNETMIKELELICQNRDRLRKILRAIEL